MDVLITDMPPPECLADLLLVDLAGLPVGSALQDVAPRPHMQLRPHVQHEVGDQKGSAEGFPERDRITPCDGSVGIGQRIFIKKSTWY